MNAQSFRVFLEAQRNVANATEHMRCHDHFELAACELEQAAAKLRSVQREYDADARKESGGLGWNPMLAERI